MRRPRFLSTVSIRASRVGRDDGCRDIRSDERSVSIRASRVGRDEHDGPKHHSTLCFNPRVPCGTRSVTPSRDRSCCRGFNPRVPCGTRFGKKKAGRILDGVSIRASRVGRDTVDATKVAQREMFQSARPVWDAIGYRVTAASQSGRFNPRVPCGTRFSYAVEQMMADLVSIRASRVGRDFESRTAHFVIYGFQSARPVWDAIASRLMSPTKQPRFQSARPVWDAISSRSLAELPSIGFQSARPVWDAMVLQSDLKTLAFVSIRASRVGRDRLCHTVTSCITCFNPRVPCGTRCRQ